MESKVVLGIIKKDSKILLLKKKLTESNLTWVFPGGE